jgi:hypothetical protein
MTVSVDTPPAAAPTPACSTEELSRLLGLVKGSDSVELKLTVPEPDQRSTVKALGIDVIQAQIRQVFFFETPELALEQSGLVVRARRVQGKGADCIVKRRPVVPADLPAELRRSAGFRVEVDALPGGFVCSFTKEQRAYFADRAPDGITLDDLVVMGPTVALKVRFTPEELGRRLVGELWFYPDGSRILELSTRCETGEAFNVAAELRVFLSSKGVDLTAEQSTKTHKALEYYAAAWRGADE